MKSRQVPKPWDFHFHVMDHCTSAAVVVTTIVQFYSDQTMKNTIFVPSWLREIIPRRLGLFKRSPLVLCQKQVSGAWVTYDISRLFHSPHAQSMVFDKRWKTLQITQNSLESMYLIAPVTPANRRQWWQSLIHLLFDKMAAISQTIFSEAFSWMKKMHFDYNLIEVCS